MLSVGKRAKMTLYKSVCFLKKKLYLYKQCIHANFATLIHFMLVITVSISINKQASHLCVYNQHLV